MLLRSVALLLFNSEGKLYCIRELIDKPEIGKRAGDYSVPWETLEPNEADASGLERVMREEVHAADPIKLSPFEYLGEIEVVAGAKANIYRSFLSEENSMPFKGSEAETEFIPLGFQDPETLLSKPRTGIEAMFRLLSQKG